MKHTRERSVLAIASLVIAVLPWASAASAQDVCGTMPRGISLPNMTIVSATPVGASGETRMPAFCEVRATISPVDGSRIGVVYRLPASWNGKVLGIGGGGAAGNLTIEAAADGLSRGYAVLQNDLGHPSPAGLDWSFAIKSPGQPNTEAIIDFGHRATHFATVVGKQLLEKFYGRPAQRAYWQGCSTGGRQGLAEVQRYPDDYDGVIAGAPVYSPVVYASAILRVQMFHARPEGNLLPAHIPLIQKAVLAACDKIDGVAARMLTDPRRCTWDPAELACSGPQSAGCLSPAQVDTVRRAYAGVKTRNGDFAAMPLMRGGESDWVTRMVGTPEMPRGVNAAWARRSWRRSSRTTRPTT